MIKRKKLFGWKNSKNYPDRLARYRLLGLDMGGDQVLWSSHWLRTFVGLSIIYLNKTLPIYSVVNNTIKDSYMEINTKVPYILLICRTLYTTFMMRCLIFTGIRLCIYSRSIQFCESIINLLLNLRVNIAKLRINKIKWSTVWYLSRSICM